MHSKTLHNEMIENKGRRRSIRHVGHFTTAALAVTTVAFSLSLVGAFQLRPPAIRVHEMPSRGRIRYAQMSQQTASRAVPLHVLKDPDAMLQESLAYQTHGKEEIRKMFQLSAGEDFQPHTEMEGRGTAKSNHPVQFKGLTSTARKRKAPPSLSPAKKSAQSKKSSSTMPGFGVDSDNQRAFRDGIRLAERRTGRKIVDTPEAKRKRKKTNGEQMYHSSTAVPESMIQFADEIHREDRITRQEEIELGEKTQEAVRLQNHFEALTAQLNREPTDEEWCAAAGKINMEALRVAIEEGLEAKNKLVTSNLRMVQSVVNTYIRNGLSGQYNAGDLMQEGILALIRAAEKFEPERGWKFSTYAMYWVRSSVKRNQIYQSRTVTVPQRLHENYKRLLRVEKDLMVDLKRQPTREELGEVIGMSELQVNRCISAMEQRCYSLDQEISNTKKPNSANSGKETLIDILDGKASDGEHERLDQHFIREDLIETLHRYLSPEEVELLLLRYGFIETPGKKLNSQITIAELSRIVGVKPDKVRRTIKKSLEQLKAVGAEEWQSFQRQL